MNKPEQIRMAGLLKVAHSWALTSRNPREESYAPKFEEARAAWEELLDAVCAVCGDTPPAGKPGHVDFGAALVMLKNASDKFRS